MKRKKGVPLVKQSDELFSGKFEKNFFLKILKKKIFLEKKFFLKILKNFLVDFREGGSIIWGGQLSCKFG